MFLYSHPPSPSHPTLLISTPYTPHIHTPHPTPHCSGGMPCFLIKPQKTSEQSHDPESSGQSPTKYLLWEWSIAPSGYCPPSYTTTAIGSLIVYFIDSSDSDDDSKEAYMMSPRSTPPPPVVPPHQGPRAYQGLLPLFQVDEEVFVDPHKPSDHHRKSGSRSPPPSSPTQFSHPKQCVKRQPPPKPPRGSTLFEDGFSPAEAKVLRSVNSIVDMDPRKLCRSYRRIALIKGPLEFDEELEDDVENKNSPPPLLQQRHEHLQRRMSWGSDSEIGRRHVNSLVELFEKDGQSAVKRSLPPPPRLRHNVAESAEQGDSIPQIPPRPSRPPCPPRPSGNSNEPPAVPPHTPAPLVPPRPVGSKVCFSTNPATHLNMFSPFQAPFIPSRERSISDSNYPVKPRPPAPPPAPPPVETHLPPIPPRLSYLLVM